ncbi:hypothetical protein [Lactococcus cremoris]
MISLILIIIVALEHLLFGYIEMFGATVLLQSLKIKYKVYNPSCS